MIKGDFTLVLPDGASLVIGKGKAGYACQYDLARYPNYETGWYEYKPTGYGTVSWKEEGRPWMSCRYQGGEQDSEARIVRPIYIDAPYEGLPTPQSDKDMDRAWREMQDKELV